MNRTGNTILITGGGSGIGEALAHRFHDRGDTVIVAGRREEALQRTIAGRANIHALTLDIDGAAGVTEFAQRLLAAQPALNVLVNNAGIMRWEALDQTRDLSDAEATIATNLLGPIRLIDTLVEHLAAQPGAAIVNVTSGLAFVPLHAAPTYCATKAAMHSYTLSLRAALRGRVEVIELAPPAVQTGLTPRQKSMSGYQPLDVFVSEVMAMFDHEPTPLEMLTPRARYLRDAQLEGRFDETMAQINAVRAPADKA